MKISDQLDNLQKIDLINSVDVFLKDRFFEI